MDNNEFKSIILPKIAAAIIARENVPLNPDHEPPKQVRFEVPTGSYIIQNTVVALQKFKSKVEKLPTTVGGPWIPEPSGRIRKLSEDQRQAACKRIRRCIKSL